MQNKAIIPAIGSLGCWIQPGEPIDVAGGDMAIAEVKGSEEYADKLEEALGQHKSIYALVDTKTGKPLWEPATCGPFYIDGDLESFIPWFEETAQKVDLTVHGARGFLVGSWWLFPAPPRHYPMGSAITMIEIGAIQVKNSSSTIMNGSLITLRVETPAKDKQEIIATCLLPHALGYFRALLERIGGVYDVEIAGLELDDGPGGRALMPKADREKMVEQWLFVVKKQGGTPQATFADDNGVGPDTFRKWITNYNHTHNMRI